MVVWFRVCKSRPNLSTYENTVKVLSFCLITRLKSFHDVAGARFRIDRLGWIGNALNSELDEGFQHKSYSGSDFEK